MPRNVAKKTSLRLRRKYHSSSTDSDIQRAIKQSLRDLDSSSSSSDSSDEEDEDEEEEDEEEEEEESEDKGDKGDEKEEVPRKGILNLGDSCYMNSALQVLFSIPEVSEYFRKVRSQIMSTNDEIDGNKKNPSKPIASRFSRVVSYMTMQKKHPLDHARIIEFLKSICKSKRIQNERLKKMIGCPEDKEDEEEDEEEDEPNFIPRQEDSAEFLMHLLEALHQDLNIRSFVDFEPLPYGEKKKKWVEYYDNQESSIINDIFGGLLSSTIKCKKCKLKKIKFEQFRTLAIEIDKCDKLKECFKKYKKKQKIDYKCNCQDKTKRKKTKKIKLVNYPEVLIIQLKRFSYSLQTGDPIKITKKVSFPSEFIPNHKVRPYDLIGTINHHGDTAESGHYIACAKVDDGWYKFNDLRVNLIDEKELQTPMVDGHKFQPYVLVYRKRRV